MTWWQAMILGIVEGLTEYLPISSTGHLLLTQRLMGIDISTQERKEVADAFAICIQGGAIVAVLGLYWARVRQMIQGFLGRDPDGLRLAINLFLGLLPAAVIGLALNSLIKEYLFGGDKWGLWPTVAAWFVGGVAILLVSWRQKRHRHLAASKADGSVQPAELSAEDESLRGTHGHLELLDLTWRMALIIGFAQCIAMWPGVSRSLVTIVGGVLVGMRLRAAVEYSFLLGVLTLGAATCKDGVDYGPQMLRLIGPMPMFIGAFFAFVSAVIAVKWMVAYLNNHGMAIFGWYRVALAIVVAGLILANVV